VSRALRLLALASALALSVARPVEAAPDAAPSGAAKRATPQSRATVLFPAQIAEGDALRAPRPADGELAAIAAQLDGLLADTAQDLGLVLARDALQLPDPTRLDEGDLLDLARARGYIVVRPRLRPATNGEAALRIELAGPTSRAVHVLRARVPYDDIPLRAVIMLRDLVTDLGNAKPAKPAQSTAIAARGVLTEPAQSEGRAIMLVNTSLFGGLVGYSIQRSSGSSDPRLLYPLLAVGAGIGLGGSILAAQEWDVGTGDAWYLAAGQWWPTLAGHLLYQGRFSPRIESDRWVFGLVGGTTGLTLSILGLALHDMSEGGALLAHSGGALGLLLGGATEIMVRGDVQTTPITGMGYGAGLGWLVAAAAATQLRVTPARVLYFDLGVMLGGLGGAAAASPLLFDHPDAGAQRAFAALTGGAAIAGGVLAIITTREHSGTPHEKRPRARTGLPTLGVLGESVIGQRRAPIVGLAWQGALD